MWDPAVLTIGFALMIVAFAAYITGCVHQWTRHAPDRRTAFCEGYDVAAQALMAVVDSGRPMPPAVAPGPAPTVAFARGRYRGS
ncbi:hypothetical protein [Actinoplanes sp. NPDC049599]|jgi:hypothetical protein|uniref:hypothetical protein n=1 Tax=Actinoplanes sp. NPDC049599 TaxID=3363903 RepID=UPI0037888EA3